MSYRKVSAVVKGITEEWEEQPNPFSEEPIRVWLGSATPDAWDVNFQPMQLAQEIRGGMRPTNMRPLAKMFALVPVWPEKTPFPVPPPFPDATGKILQPGDTHVCSTVSARYDDFVEEPGNSIPGLCWAISGMPKDFAEKVPVRGCKWAMFVIAKDKMKYEKYLERFGVEVRMLDTPTGGLLLF